VRALIEKLTFWRVVFVLIMMGGVAATYMRVMYGLGGSTNLSDEFPWGIWIGFDILCGVGLAAGGFTIVAAVHIFNLEKFKPILRPTILTAFLGYGLVVVALMFDLGRPDRIWHPMVMWNPHSVMFEVAWCVMLYNTVLALEFAPAVCEKFGFSETQKWIKWISVPLVITGVILSTLHQSSLGSLYLSVPSKLYALWYTPFLPVFFYISAICVGLAMMIFEARHSARAFNRDMHLPLLASLSRVLAVLIAFYTVLRFADLRHREALELLWIPRMETYLFWMEIGLFLAGMGLLFLKRVRVNADALYGASLFVIFGFLTNRLNVSIMGMEAASGTKYIPKWTEIMITLSVVAAGFAIFRMAVKYLPVFDEPQEEDHEHDDGDEVKQDELVLTH
jgi:Ni/Fe-hydrogenase subunit HybB-like protein